MHPSKRANWRKESDQPSSPARGRGPGQIYANCSFSEASASRSNVNYASPTISSSLKKTGQMPDKTSANSMKEHQATLKKLLAAKLEAVELSLKKKSPSEAKEEEEGKEVSQVVPGEVIYMADQVSTGGGSDCGSADSLLPIFEEKEDLDEDFANSSSGSYSPPSHGSIEEKSSVTADKYPDDEKSFDGGEQVDGNSKQTDNDDVDDASEVAIDDEHTQEKMQNAKSETSSSVSADMLLTPKAKQQRHTSLPQQQKPSKDGRIKELQAKLSQLETQLKALQEAKAEKKKVVNGKTPLGDSFDSPLPPLTTEQQRIIASDKCSSGGSSSSPPPEPSSLSGGAQTKATLVLDGVHHLPLPRDFNRLASVQRDLILIALPEAVRERYLNMCWEARFFEQMTVAPMKAARQELLLSLKL